jgi:hypothetical protein
LFGGVAGGAVRGALVAVVCVVPVDVASGAGVDGGGTDPVETLVDVVALAGAADAVVPPPLVAGPPVVTVSLIGPEGPLSVGAFRQEAALSMASIAISFLIVISRSR